MLILGNSLDRLPAWFGPYVAASSAVLAFSLDSGVFRIERRKAWIPAVLALATLASALVVGLSALLLWTVRGVATPLPALLAPWGIALIAALINTALERRDPELPRSRDWTGWRFLLSLLAGGAIVALQAGGWVASWELARS